MVAVTLDVARLRAAAAARTAVPAVPPGLPAPPAAPVAAPYAPRHGTRPALLRGASVAAGGTVRPVILKRAGDDFVQMLLDELADRDGLTTALDSAVRGPGLALYQPVHRNYHVVLLEVACDVAGLPRLDPARIESAGLVVRRQAVDATGQLMDGVLEGWVEDAPTARSRAEPAPADSPAAAPAGAPAAAANAASARRALRGWTRLAGTVAMDGTVSTPASELDRDPDPARRPPRLRTGHPELDRRLAVADRWAALAERVTPLFAAPPAVCAAAGRTLLYGLVPVTSTEFGQLPNGGPPRPSDVDVGNHLPGFLRPGMPFANPRAGESVTVADVEADAEAADAAEAARAAGVTAAADDGDGTPGALAKFAEGLRQLVAEFGLTDTAEADDHIKALRTALWAAVKAVSVQMLEPAVWDDWSPDAVRALFAAADRSTPAWVTTPRGPRTVGGAAGFKELPGHHEVTLAAWLDGAARALVLGASDKNSAVDMPIRWPAPTPKQAADILKCVQDLLAARLATIVPREPRFGDPDRAYQLRAFVRVRGSDDCGCGCGAGLAWSAHSEAFTIRPWYEASDQPPAIITLPEPGRAMAPSVAFRVPKSLMGVLTRNDPKKMAGGEGKPVPNGGGGDGGGMDWICAFSIPTITLCAYIVLNIFLSLFDIIFGWMLAVKLCIPVPRRSSGSSP